MDTKALPPLGSVPVRTAPDSAQAAPASPASAQPPPIDNTFTVHADGFDSSAAPATLWGRTVDVQYYGGGVLAHPDVVPVYLGNYFKSGAGRQERLYNDAAIGDLVRSAEYTSVWAQYGVGVGTSEKSHVIASDVPPKSTVTDAQLQQLLRQGINDGSLAPKTHYAVKDGDTLESVARQLIVQGRLSVDVPTAVGILQKMNPGLDGPLEPGQRIQVPRARKPDAIYTFVLPPDVTLVSAGGDNSRAGLGGYHGSIHDAAGNPVYYAAIVSSQGSNGIDFNGVVRDNVTVTEAHEISEAATDPNVGDAIAQRDPSKLGWYDPWNGEIGDLAVNDKPQGVPLSTAVSPVAGDEVAQVQAQKIWSQVDQTNETRALKPGVVQPLPPPTKLWG